MHEMQSIFTDVRSMCLSHGSSKLHCAKLAKHKQMLFGVNTPVIPWNTVLDVSPDPPTERGLSFKFWDALLSSERLKLET